MATELIPLFGSYSLHPLALDDAPAIFGIIDTQREYLGEWLEFVETTKTVEESRLFVEYVLREGLFVYTIRDGPVIIGLVGFNKLESGEQEIGYWLHNNFQGKHLITESVKKLYPLSFSVLKQSRAIIRCAVGNEKSNRIPRQCGFSFVGTFHTEKGAHRDVNLYEIKDPNKMQE
jgi:ribosomal-protein-serine acetyltransferase